MKIFTLVILVLASTFFTGCLPVEEPILPPPLTTIPEMRTLRTFLVERGDVLLTSNPTTTYLPVRQEVMHFNVAGRRIRGIFVSIGDEVREGDVLAELDNPYIADQLRDARWNEEWLLLQISQLNERHNFSLNQANVTGQPIDDTHYINERLRLQDELGLAQMRTAQIESEIEHMQILAPFDGIVTWALDFVGVMWSAIGQAVITVSDQGQYVFHLRGMDASIVETGQYYDLTIGRDVFPAIAIDPDEDDFIRPAQFGTPENEAFFRLVGDDRPLITGSTFASVFLLHDAAYDVVFIPTMLVNIVGERTFVHVLEDDIIVIRDVVTGLRGNNTTEIVYGLEEGDLVVIT